MLKITLKDGALREVEAGTSILDFVKENTFGNSISEIWGERSLAIDPNNVCKIIKEDFSS